MQLQKPDNEFYSRQIATINIHTLTQSFIYGIMNYIQIIFCPVLFHETEFCQIKVHVTYELILGILNAHVKIIYWKSLKNLSMKNA